MAKRVLIADDEPQVAEIISAALTEGGFETVKALDGLSAWKLLAEQKFDLVFTDIKMPEMDGLELLASMREVGNYTPVVVFTGFANTETLRRAWQLGAYDFMEKPIDLDHLQRAAETAVAGGAAFNRAHPDRLTAGKFQVVTVQLDQNLYQDVRAECEKSGKSVTTLVTDLLKSRLKAAS